ncbi:MAG: efflux transporter outer membrane subunit [Lautropia sp.]
MPRRLLPAVLAAALSACTVVGPDYVRPELPVPAEYRQLPPSGWKASEAGDRLPRGAWWTVFDDPVLSALAGQAVRSNASIAVGEATVRRARAQLAQTESARYPSLGASAGGSRTTSSVANELGGGTQSSETWRAGVDASWEIDLWGRVRRSVEAGSAQLAAADADLENVRLVIITELARNYFALRIVDAQRQLFDDTVAAYQRSLELTRNRYASGVVPRVDVVQAEVQLKSTLAQRIDSDLQRAALESTIAVLVGRMPSTFQIDPITAAPPRPGGALAANEKPELAPVAEPPGIPRVPVIPVGLPSTLLERRPDVAAAERSIAAANAQIGVAEAARYPSLSLSASAGLRGSSFSDLLRAPSWLWSPALSIAQALFDAGQRRAVTEQTRAGYEAQLASYRGVVLQAFKEVEDNLASLRVLEQELALQTETLAAARLALQLVTNQYQAGVVNYLNVITAQTSALNSERSLLDLRGRRLAASVALIRALGGGWQAGAGTGSEPGAGSEPESESESEPGAGSGLERR